MFKLRLPTWEKGRMSSETGGLKGIPVGNTGHRLFLFIPILTFYVFNTLNKTN